MQSFSSSILAKSGEILLPYFGMLLRRTLDVKHGFSFISTQCRLHKIWNGKGRPGSHRCDNCAQNKKVSEDNISHKFNPRVELAPRKTPIRHIANDPAMAELEIRYGRSVARRLAKQLARAILDNEKSVLVTRKEGKKIFQAVNVMSDTIVSELDKSGEPEACELWLHHRDRINEHFKYSNGRKNMVKRGPVPVHPVILNWSIAFLARTSSSTYREVAKIMLLPDISFVYRKTKELVSRSSDKGYSIHIATIQTISKRAKKEKWTQHQRTGCLANDSANINAGIEHDHVTNTFVGGDESHRIGTLSNMFHLMTQKVKSHTAAAESNGTNDPQNQNSILDELRLAKEHLVFKFTSLDPDIKCSEIVASINVEKVNPELIATVTEILIDTLPIYGVHVGFETSDAAGCNWVAFNSLATLSVSDILPKEIMDIDPSIDFDINLVYQCPVTNRYVIFLPDMPHLTKNIVTATELSGSKFSKRDIKFGKCPINLSMVEDVWIESDGTSGQLQQTKLSFAHFDKNAYSRMNVSLAMQVLSASVASMIRSAINDDEIFLALENKQMYNHLADLCDKWDLVVDICNGRDGAHSPENARTRQMVLLDVLSWFTKWEKLHLAAVENGEATEFNFFAQETWFGIRSLILAHVCAIQMYSVQNGQKVNPRSMNTDVVEWFFGDGRQMVGGSTNKMTARQWNHAGFKAAAFNAGKHGLVGNNKTGVNMFDRHYKF